MPENQLKFIREVIYDLKRAYGGPVDIYQNIPGETDFTTGEKTFTKQHWRVAHVIRLPRNIHRDAIFTATGSRLFAFGNIIELADRNIIIDWRDLPSGFNFKAENWYVVIDDQHYDIVKVIEFDNRAAIYVILKQLVGAPREAIIETAVQSILDIAQTVDEVIE